MRRATARGRETDGKDKYGSLVAGEYVTKMPSDPQAIVGRTNDKKQMRSNRRQNGRHRTGQTRRRHAGAAIPVPQAATGLCFDALFKVASLLAKLAVAVSLVPKCSLCRAIYCSGVGQLGGNGIDGVYILRRRLGCWKRSW
jgi:hypothetical protein